MGTFVFRAEIEESEEGIWEAEIPIMPGCAVWGYTREEALEAMHDVAQAFVELMLENGERVPAEEGIWVESDRETIISVVVPAAVTSEKRCRH